MPLDIIALHYNNNGAIALAKEEVQAYRAAIPHYMWIPQEEIHRDQASQPVEDRSSSWEDGS